MDKIIVLSDEPALAQAIGDELPQYAVEALRPPAAWPADARLAVAEKKILESIAPTQTVPLLVVARPIRLRELLYTIAARLQAQTPRLRDEMGLIGGHNYSPRERLLASPQGKQVVLTEKESELFVTLLEKLHETLSRDQLLFQVWGYKEEADTHTLETHIYRLRSKLRQAELDYDIISSEEGGYRIVPK